MLQLQCSVPEYFGMSVSKYFRSSMPITYLHLACILQTFLPTLFLPAHAMLPTTSIFSVHCLYLFSLFVIIFFTLSFFLSLFFPSSECSHAPALSGTLLQWASPPDQWPPLRQNSKFLRKCLTCDFKNDSASGG